MTIFENLSEARKIKNPVHDKQVDLLINADYDGPVLEVHYDSPEIDSINEYFYDIEENGKIIEDRLLRNYDKLKAVVENREKEILMYVPDITLKMKPQEIKGEEIVPQRKI